MGGSNIILELKIMAEIKITVPDPQVGNLIEAFAWKFDYDRNNI